MNPGTKLNSGTKLLLSAIAALAVVLVVWLAARGGSAGPQPVPTDAAPALDPAPAPAVRQAPPTPENATGPGAVRTEVRPDAGRPEPTQGFGGRVIDASGTPVEAAEVFLVEGHSRDIFTALVLRQRGVIVPPVAKATTDRNGRFVLGVRSVAPGGYEIRVLSDRHAEGSVPNLTLFEDRFVDVGDVKLPAGFAMVGRVMVQGGNGFPIPDARVIVRPEGIVPTMSPTPGREDGIEVRADAAGNFRVENLAAGFVHVTALAPGFARVERQNVEIRADLEIRVDFELPKGQSIAGKVTDREGRGIEGARVEAILLSGRETTGPITRTDADGAFEVLGLVDGPYQLAATALGFVREERKPVRAGARDEVLALRPQATVRVRVTDQEARPVTRFDVLLLAWRAEQDALGYVPTAQVERVLPVDLRDGWFDLHHVDPGAYVLRVEASGFAKTVSEPFTVAVDAAPPDVDVRMREGGALDGLVTGVDGQPLAGVTVATLPDYLDDSLFGTMVSSMIPTRITQTSTRTGANGRFTISRLAPGTYKLRFDRDDLCTAWVDSVEVVDGELRTIPDVRVPRGTLVTGTVMLDGAPAGQVKVSIASLPDPARADAPMFHTDAISDDDGRFAIPRRLPPGTYQGQAARQTLPNPILQVVDYQKTRQEFSVAPGQETYQLHFTLKSD